MRNHIRAVLTSLAFVVLFGSISVAFAAIVSSPVTIAKAVLLPTRESAVSGEVLFSQQNNGVKIVVDVTGLSPGDHGFHIHEFGDCSAVDAKSAGEHFNPTHTQHGARDAIPRHIGDLGNLVADESGRAHYEWLDKDITLNGSHSILGRSVIVHAGPDDLKTQPSGNSGARLACGVIGVVNTP